MANTVIALRSSGVASNTPSLGVLANGELSLNFADGILYYKSSSNTLGSIRTTAVSGLTTEVQFNDAGSFGANSNFTFNKTIATLNVKNINVSTNLATVNLTATSITTGTGVGGIIAGANVIYSNVFVANSGGYVQFSDGSKQYTANAGSGSSGVTQIVAGTNVTISPAGGTGVVTINSSGASSDTFARTQANAAFDKANTAYSAATTAQGTADSAASTATAAYNTYDLASIYTPNNSTTVSATGRSDTFNLVGESGIYVYSNATTKTVTFAGGIQSLPGAQGMTVDYGFVSEAIFYNIDYGTL
jgi:hypothetical protein